jgi:hypothetical protein
MLHDPLNLHIVPCSLSSKIDDFPSIGLRMKYILWDAGHDHSIRHLPLASNVVAQSYLLNAVLDTGFDFTRFDVAINVDLLRAEGDNEHRDLKLSE